MKMLKLKRAPHWILNLVGVAAIGLAAKGLAAAEPDAGGLIDRIESQAVIQHHPGGHIWAQCRATIIPDPSGKGGVGLMTMQPVTGSDVYGHVYCSESHDQGKTWSEPEPVPDWGRTQLDPELQAGVCDIVPDYHPATDTVLAIGQTIYYRKEQKQFKDHPPTRIQYAVRTRAGVWSKPQILEWDDPRGGNRMASGCSQRVTLPDGKILLPMYCAPIPGPEAGTGRDANRDFKIPAGVMTLICEYDGQKLKVVQAGELLTHPVKRGLLEPSITYWNRRFYLTLRTEDGHGYVSVSSDGLHWDPIKPWAWEDGEPLTMSTTQQHWLNHSDRLYLVYTRKAENNTNVFRWRAPLFVAEVDSEKLCLRRSTEQIAVPLTGDPEHDPKNVPQLGNFQIVTALPGESWITLGEIINELKKGSVRVSHIFWKQPNRGAIAQ